MATIPAGEIVSHQPGLPSLPRSPSSGFQSATAGGRRARTEQCRETPPGPRAPAPGPVARVGHGGLVQGPQKLELELAQRWQLQGLLRSHRLIKLAHFDGNTQAQTKRKSRTCCGPRCSCTWRQQSWYVLGEHQDSTGPSLLRVNPCGRTPCCGMEALGPVHEGVALPLVMEFRVTHVISKHCK